jgi:predicted deacylase
VNHSFDWKSFLPAFEREAASRGFSATTLLETPAGPLAAWECPAPGPRIYLSAGIHGDEPAGPLALLELLRRGCFTPAAHWILCPALNPVGLAAGTRESPGGIDLNRDYLRRRSCEAGAHARWLEKLPPPALFLSLHEDWEARGFYFYEINLADDDPQRAAAILGAVSPWFAPDGGHEIDGHSPRAPGWIFHAAEADVPDGWPEAIFLAHHGCPLSFTFETPSHAALDARVAAHCAAVQAILVACRQVTGLERPERNTAQGNTRATWPAGRHHA